MAVLKASKREAFGTRKVRPLREAGMIPGVVYGHGEEPLAITLSRHDLAVALAHGERLLELDVAGNSQNVLVKEVQYDPLGQDILHVDLTRVDLDERVEVTVPILLRGTAAGVADGGVVHQVAAEVTIECPVRAIPEEIRVSVEPLQIDDALHMKDLPLPDGTTLVDEPDTLVATVSVVREEVEAPEAVEAEAAEPEVIGKQEEKEEAPETGEESAE